MAKHITGRVLAHEDRAHQAAVPHRPQDLVKQGCLLVLLHQQRFHHHRRVVPRP